MPLPKIDLPTYDLILPSSGQEVTIKPFTVKEEKLLFMAAESADESAIISTTKQVITNCVLSEDFNVEKLPFFDVDYLFIALRAKSIGEAIEMQFTCNAEVDNKPCKHVFTADIDISQATVDRDEDITNNVVLNNNLTVKLKYPNYTTMRLLGGDEALLDKKVNLIAACIDMIVDGEEVHSSKDYSKEELIEFVEGLTEEYFQKLSRFVENFPTFSVKMDAKCPKCGFTHYIRYTDFSVFFQ